jgi:hypothetical protein
MPLPECEEMLANCWDYLDGNCSAQVATRIDAHVSSCVVCLRLLRFQESFFASLTALRERPLTPARVQDRVGRALAAERRERALGIA